MGRQRSPRGWLRYVPGIMGGFRSIAFPLLLVFALGIPLLVLITGVFSTMTLMRRGSTALRKAGLFSVLGTAAFLALDTLLLKALPWLGLSYGSVRFTWIVLVGLRATLLTAWLILLLQRNRRAVSSPRLLPLWLAHTLVLLLVVYSFYIEPFAIHTSRIPLHAPISQLRYPLRIVQISDLHVERTTVREQALLPLIQSLAPDVIMLTGDYLNLSFLGDPESLQDARNFIGQLSAPYGIYAVNGSVDNRDLMRALFDGTQVTILQDTAQQINLPGSSLYVIGINDWTRERDEGALNEISNQLPQNAYRLLLHHTPDLAPSAAQSGVDLYLAGHTHGGQIRLPLYGAIVTASFYGKAYEAGQYQLGNMTLYVSRGLGMEGGQAPRARFLSPPELVVIDLLPDPDLQER